MSLRESKKSPLVSGETRGKRHKGKTGVKKDSRPFEVGTTAAGCSPGGMYPDHTVEILLNQKTSTFPADQKRRPEPQNRGGGVLKAKKRQGCVRG